MSTDKDKMMRGINFMAFSFPLIFFGPALFFWKGASGLNNGQWWWAVISVVLMGVAVFLVVKGLRLVLAGLFNKN